MNSSEDKDKIMSAFGGKKGLIDSGIPTVFFLITFNITKDLQSALIAALGISALLTIIRLLRRETLQHSIGGLIGVLIAAWFANRSGNAIDAFIPKLLTNLGYGTAYLIANLVGWPILGLMLGPILGEDLRWRKDPARKAAYILAGWLWVGMFFIRLLVQVPLYLADELNLLGTVNLLMGYPLFFATAYGTWLILKSVPTSKPPAED
jgi:hypothetical protein